MELFTAGALGTIGYLFSQNEKYTPKPLNDNNINKNEKPVVDHVYSGKQFNKTQEQIIRKANKKYNESLKQELVSWVRSVIGPIASPDIIQWAPNLPKTRSGKIMRRILRKIAEGDLDNLGDTTTLAEPAVVDSLKDNRKFID